MRNVTSVDNVQFEEDGTMMEVEFTIFNVRQGKYRKEWHEVSI